MLSPVKFGSLFFALAALTSEAAAHYRWTKLIANGVTTAEYQYVRSSTNSNSPVSDISSTDLRCNVGGLASGSKTSTATVAAGTTIGFALDSTVTHPGVLNIYLGKVPSGSTAATWDGSGANWFKVHQISAVTNGGTSITWPTDGISQVTFKLPSATPTGQYLMRVEHIALHGVPLEEPNSISVAPSLTSQEVVPVTQAKSASQVSIPETSRACSLTSTGLFLRPTLSLVPPFGLVKRIAVLFPVGTIDTVFISWNGAEKVVPNRAGINSICYKRSLVKFEYTFVVKNKGSLNIGGSIGC